jgi:hypothetical protein
MLGLLRHFELQHLGIAAGVAGDIEIADAIAVDRRRLVVGRMVHFLDRKFPSRPSPGDPRGTWCDACGAACTCGSNGSCHLLAIREEPGVMLVVLGPVLVVPMGHVTTLCPYGECSVCLAFRLRDIPRALLPITPRDYPRRSAKRRPSCCP